MPLKLPGLIRISDYGGDWEKYLEAIYTLFKIDFIDNQAFFNGTILGLKRYPLIRDKEATFWHLITKDDKEAQDRLADLRRCERIKWPKFIIDNNKDDDIKVWETIKNNDLRIHIAYKWEYVVVLSRRKGYLLLWTAFVVEHNHKKKKMKKEYDSFVKKQTPPQ